MEQKTFTAEDKVIAEEIKILKSGVNIINHAANLKTYRELLLMCYRHSVNHEGLKRLEDLDPEIKLQIWAEVKGDCTGLNKTERIELSKVFYLISERI